jgi:hypothetical protein
MSETIQKLCGANMDIDLATPQGKIDWEQDQCPWNLAEDSSQHKCAVKDISICPYFRGIEPLDIVLCSYPNDDVKSETKS